MRRLLPSALRGLVVGVLACAVAACAPGGDANGDGEPTTSGPTTTTTTTEEPDPDPTTLDPDPTTPPTSTSGNDNPAISIANLPVGGAAEPPSHPTLQCAPVSWIVDQNGEIPPGIAVELTTVIFTSKVFTAVSGGCGSEHPDCLDYIFRSNAQRCDLLVKLTGTFPEEGASVGFEGLVYCPDNSSATCRDFVSALGDQTQISVGLTEYVPPETTTTPPSETTTTDTTGTTTTDGG